MMKFRLFHVVCVTMLCLSSFGITISAKNNIPAIGAQVFIEPGQSAKDIESFFKILKENNLSVARIRMFGAHIVQPDGKYDFSLYDNAFDMADKYGVRIFVTLFPPTDELTDVGGFKFPKSKDHLKDIEQYIKAVVTRYKDRKSLDTWVLQNEPGGSRLNLAGNSWVDEMRLAFGEQYKRNSGEYLKGDFTEDHFYRFCLTEYLRWIANIVNTYDPVHNKHINPHQLLDNLSDYDFKEYESFLTSLGVSMHQSWHFGYFTRSQYTLGVSIMADIIRTAAGKNPFWITELQGGNVTASGSKVICPTKEEISQWLWTGISSGAEGIIFWTLNQRMAVREAGEWGMLDFQRNPSDRLLAASEVSETLTRNRSFFSQAGPVQGNITILYNLESLLIQNKNSKFSSGEMVEGRMASAVMKSVCGAYEALSSWGITPEICDMDSYDWNNSDNRCIIIPNIISLPSRHWDHIRNFVKSGGRAIVTGMTGFYDENMRCLHLGDFPLENCFGARIKEYKAGNSYFDLTTDHALKIPVHQWRCSMTADKALPICIDSGEVSGTRNKYGKGEVIWFPVQIELGGWQRRVDSVSAFYGEYCQKEISVWPLRFAKAYPGVSMRLMETEDQRMAVIINKTDTTAVLELAGDIPVLNDRIAGSASIFGNTLSIGPEDCSIFIWKK